MDYDALLKFIVGILNEVLKALGLGDYQIELDDDTDGE